MIPNTFILACRERWEKDLESSLITLSKPEIQQTAERICTLFSITTLWEKRLISALCSDTNYDRFEWEKDTTRYIVAIQGDRPVMPCSYRTKKKIQTAFLNTNFAYVKQSTPRGRSRITERIFLPKL